MSTTKIKSKKKSNGATHAGASIQTPKPKKHAPKTIKTGDAVPTILEAKRRWNNHTVRALNNHGQRHCSVDMRWLVLDGVPHVISPSEVYIFHFCKITPSGHVYAVLGYATYRAQVEYNNYKERHYADES